MALHWVWSRMRVRLTRKLAQMINGFDLRPFDVGSSIDLADPMGRMLIAEGWAVETVAYDTRHTADDRAARPRTTQRAGRTGKRRGAATTSSGRRGPGP